MRMIPENASSNASAAERRIFEQLKKTDVPGWMVGFHSINLPAHERKRVCEIDFLILGERGVLVLEVKGGRVTRTGGVWHSQDLRGVRHRLKESPLEQASSAMFALSAKLQNLVGRELVARTVFGHGVVLPDVDFDVSSVEWAEEMVIDRKYIEVDGWAQALERLGKFWTDKPGRRRELSQGDVELYLGHLRPDFDLVPSLRHLSRAVDEELVALTERQYKALDTYARNRRLIFEGGAGTGKTMLAAEICRRAQQQGSTVLLTCRSAVLAAFVRSQPGLDGVTVVPFYRTPELPEAGFDLVVVDEAQDVINDDDLRSVDRLLVGGLQDGSWAFLLDANNQKGLVGRYEETAMAELREHRPTELMLTDNCRNTVEIVTATRRRTGADLGVTTAGHGLEVTSIEGPRPLVGEQLATVLDQLEGDQVPMDHVVLLSAHNLVDSVFSALPDRWRRRIDILDLAHMRSPTPGRLGFARVADFKGLESPLVVLEAEPQNEAAVGRALLYVGMTRARAALWTVAVTGPGTREMA
jgi:Nuclease-related domain/AAA domain/UvrD-like helicase C-terminal domain